MRRMSFAVWMSIVVLAACAPPTAQESADIAARAEVWMTSFEARDIDALVDLYTEDARLLPPNGEMVQGHDAIRADFQAMMDAGLSGSLETVEAMSVGDLGYRVGTFTLTTPDGAMADRGKYIETWRNVGGEWKIANDIYNSDLPPAPAGKLTMGTHEVGDAGVWLAAWLEGDARREQFAAHGVPSVKVFQDPENPNFTGVLLDVVDMDAFQAFLASEEGAAAAAEDTVKMDTLRVLNEVQ